MKLLSIVKILVMSGLLTFAVLGSASLLADESPTDPAATSSASRVQESNQKQVGEKKKEILEEATVAIEETKKALMLLEQDNRTEALAALERATGKLQIILARDPDLSLAPTSAKVITYDLDAGLDDVKWLSNRAQDALEDGRVQDARRLLGHLASETIISVTNLPLSTYPDAIKSAASHIESENIDDAKRVLKTALNTLVMSDTIIPLPVVHAEELLKEAEELAEIDVRNEQQNNYLEELLVDARKQLQLAEAFGYGSEKDFENLYDQIEMIRENIGDGQSGANLFSKIKEYLSDTRDSSQKG